MRFHAALGRGGSTFDTADAEIRETNGYLDTARAENAGRHARLPGSLPGAE
jgi:hypothetical protein